MKQELIKRLNACCMLTFSLMLTWIDSLIFPNDGDGSFKAYLKTQIKPNGELSNSAWILLLQNAKFEIDAPITSAVAVEWLQSRTCPTCDQFKVIINSLELKNSFPMYVENHVLDLVELNVKLYSVADINKNRAFVMPLAYMNGMLEAHQVFIAVPEFHIRNFDLIKNLNPYLIIERLTPSRRRRKKKSGWKRDKTMMVLGDFYHDFHNGGDILISEENGYRPNEIPLTSSRQQIDLFIENYFVLPNSTNKLKRIGTNRRSSSSLMPNGLIPMNTIKHKIQVRFRIGFKVGNEEKVSKPLLKFSIFAQQGQRDKLLNDQVSSEPCVVFSIAR